VVAIVIQTSAAAVCRIARQPFLLSIARADPLFVNHTIIQWNGGDHRSAHSTYAGGISLRTIITRKMRSSWRSVAVPARAASTVA
jgi:hypothetical protein